MFFANLGTSSPSFTEIATLKLLAGFRHTAHVTILSAEIDCDLRRAGDLRESGLEPRPPQLRRDSRVSFGTADQSLAHVPRRRVAGAVRRFLLRQTLLLDQTPRMENPHPLEELLQPLRQSLVPAPQKGPV